MDAEWLSPGEAAAMLDESPQTLRRWADKHKLEARTTPAGHREYNGAMVRQLRASKLERLGAVEPSARGSAQDPADLASRYADSVNEVAQLRAERDRLAIDLAKTKDALSMTMAADDAADERTQVWKGVARALMGDVVPSGSAGGGVSNSSAPGRP